MSNIPVTVDRAGLWDAEALSDVAAATFPLACPPGASADDIEIFLEQVLSGERFGEYLNDPDRTVLKAVAGGEIVGYAMLVAGDPADPEVARVVDLHPALEISKMYVLPGHHGTGVSTALMGAALRHAREGGYPGVWLGVNQENHRAQRFYAKHGFEQVGTKTFTVGREVHHDYVLRLVF
ncbi:MULTISPECIES: GNAT family N-acetyltransferase [Nocardia]|uniref:Protease synthase and sporulation negative regulatory protein PAI 1 n=1 Tax=Nocardia farcinica TaxID=37329 RepID=A0A0H5NEC6_NOCFR|nr:Protease synthase and sporulation negative regulatory protein PAI 1 [Nocardia farcinica]SIT29541.1 Acetyltransferase (GNAT) family protein [Nocardia farcinica]SUE27350.1 N-acetlytransferase [Nocardia farcinica]